MQIGAPTQTKDGGPRVAITARPDLVDGLGAPIGGFHAAGAGRAPGVLVADVADLPG